MNTELLFIEAFLLESVGTKHLKVFAVMKGPNVAYLFLLGVLYRGLCSAAKGTAQESYLQGGYCGCEVRSKSGFFLNVPRTRSSKDAPKTAEWETRKVVTRIQGQFSDCR